MPKVRKAVAATVSGFTLIAASGVGAAMAADSPTGVGTANASTSLLHIQLNGADGTAGRLMDARIVNDVGQSTIDTSKYDAQGLSQLSAAKLASAANPISGQINFNTPTLESRTPGGNSPVSTPDISLTAPSPTLTGLIAAVASGTVGGATLATGLDANGASSSLTGAALNNLNLIGGLVNVTAPSGVLATSTAATQSFSQAARSITIPTVTALDLSNLLASLGIQLGKLPVATVTSLLDQLGIPVAGLTLPTGMTLSQYVASLQSALTDLQAAITAAGANPTGTITSTLDGLLGTLGVGSITTTPTVATLQSTVTTVTTDITNALKGAVTALNAAPLLQIAGGQVAVTSKAADTVGNSVASVTGTIGGFKVGSVSLPGVDFGADLASASAAVNSALNSVLTKINANLANLVTVSLWDKSTSVSNANGYNQAAASVSAVTAKFQVPDISKLSAVLIGLNAGTGVASTISTLQGAAYTAPLQEMTGGNPALGQLGLLTFLPASLTNGVLSVTNGLVVNGVAQTSSVVSGGSIKIGEIATSADFAPSVATTSTPGELPRTGASIALAALGFLLVAFGLWVFKAGDELVQQ